MRERFEKATAAGFEDGGRNQDSAASRSWKSKETDSPKEPAKECSPANTLILQCLTCSTVG